MTQGEANDRISAAIELLKSVRDALGQELALHPSRDTPETRQLSNLHDRAALALSSFRQG